MMHIKFALPKIVVTGVWLLVAQSVFSQTITGNVFYDINLNGAKEATETGVPTITVTAYNTAGTSAATATTSATGDYTLSGLTASQNYRVEFTALPSGYFNGVTGSASGTTVQFVASPATNVNLGIGASFGL